MTQLVADHQLARNEILRRFSLLGIAGVVSGLLVGGVLGRIVMRLSAIAAGPEMAGRLTENGNRVGEFTVAGTLILIVFVGGFAGVAGSLLVAGSDPWLRWMGPLQGLGFGFVAYAVVGFGDPFTGFDLLIFEPRVLNVAMFVGLSFIFGFSVSGVYWLLDRRLPPASDGEQVGYLIVSSLVVLPLMLVIALFTVPDFCGCEPDFGFLAIILGMVVSTVGRHATSFFEEPPVWIAPVSTIAGYGSLVLLLFVGLTRGIDQITRIL